MAWASKLSEERPRLSLRVLEDEALALVRFCRTYWEPVRDEHGQVVRPGLASAVGTGTFKDDAADELIEVHAALVAATRRHRLLMGNPAPALMKRAEEVITELRQGIAWRFAEGSLHESKRKQLRKLGRDHGRARSHDAVAAALADHAALAERNLKALAEIPAFEPRLVPEAWALCTRLRELSSGPKDRRRSDDPKSAMALRNRMAALLYERMLRTRAAARFVFHRHPDIVREATSAYERKERGTRRARARRHDAEAKEPSGTPGG